MGVTHDDNKSDLKLGQGHSMVTLGYLVTRNLHAKYECSSINNSEDMVQVKLFLMTNQIDKQMSSNAPYFLKAQVTSIGAYDVQAYLREIRRIQMSP